MQKWEWRNCLGFSGSDPNAVNIAQWQEVQAECCDDSDGDIAMQDL